MQKQNVVIAGYQHANKNDVKNATGSWKLCLSVCCFGEGRKNSRPHFTVKEKPKGWILASKLEWRDYLF